MSVSPKYRTNFSVNDILSPLDETQLLKSATASEYLLHEFRNSENNNSKLDNMNLFFLLYKLFYNVLDCPGPDFPFIVLISTATVGVSYPPV